MSGLAGLRESVRPVRRLGVHRDLDPRTRPTRAPQMADLVRSVELDLAIAVRVLVEQTEPTGSINVGPINVRWYQRTRVPSDVWATDWWPWRLYAPVSPHAVALRCCAWVDLS